MQEASTRTWASAGELDHRARLVEAIAQAVTEKGYAQTTIADVVRHAHVSKRTFYEHFSDKEECFLAACTRLSERVLANIASAARLEEDVEARLEATAQAYVSTLEEQPAMTRAFLIEIQAAGPRALGLRRAILGRFADLLRALVEVARKQRPELRALSPAMATALVGGINELLLLTAEEGGAGFREVGQTAIELVRSVLSAPATLPSPRATRSGREAKGAKPRGRGR